MNKQILLLKIIFKTPVLPKQKKKKKKKRKKIFNIGSSQYSPRFFMVNWLLFWRVRALLFCRLYRRDTRLQGGEPLGAGIGPSVHPVTELWDI
jgi:hypothetical protein